MASILFVQFRTDESEKHERKCVLRHVPHDTKIDFLSAHDEWEYNPLILEDYGAIILGGLGEADLTETSNVTVQKIIRKMRPLISDVIETDFPLLGICFGHQLLAQVAGGLVEHDLNLAETGIHEIEILTSARDDGIFNKLPERFKAVVGHKDTVTQLPDGAVMLASNEYAPNQAFRLGSNIYGVQFHGELDEHDLKERLKLYPEYNANIRDFNFEPTPHAPLVLRNFVERYS